MMPFVFLYVTCANKKEARKIAEHLLEQKYVACANFFPLESTYWWKGKITLVKEYALILKTTMAKVGIVKQEIEKRHSYSIPCITQIKVKPNQKYARWLEEQLR